MKKTAIIAAAAIMSAAAAKAQVHPTGTFTIQPKVGVTVANITKAESDSKVGLVAGAEVEYQVADRLGISAGLLYSMQGAKGGVYDLGVAKGNSKLNTEYVNVPILAKIYLIGGLSVNVGPQFGFLTKAQSKVSAEVLGKKVDTDNDLKSVFNNTDISLPIGASYEMAGFVLDARYNIGLNNVYQNNIDGKNSVVQVTLGYRFAL